MYFQIIDSGRMNPQSIMDKDHSLLNQLSSIKQPLLHLYEWQETCLTYGYFTNPSQHLHLSALHKHRVSLARRPTGGGIIFHLTDFAFSILVPASSPYFSLNTLENYAFINRLVAQSIGHLSNQMVQPQLFVQTTIDFESASHFCMAKPTKYDLIVNGKKLGGASQRRTKQGFLHQGSLSITLPSINILQDVLKDPLVISAMQKHSYPLISTVHPQDLADTRQLIKQQLIATLREFSGK
jgi:lipoate-protein ligase A